MLKKWRRQRERKQKQNNNKNRSNQQKTQLCKCSTLFLVHFFAVVLHNVKFPETSQLHILQRKCFMCSCSPFFFFHCRSFSPWWPLASLIFSPPLSNFHVFLQTKLVSVVFLFHALTIKQTLKFSQKKDSALLMFFPFTRRGVFLQAKKSAGCPWPRSAISRQKRAFPPPTQALFKLPPPPLPLLQSLYVRVDVR